jgi:hypothetical protein
MDDREIKQLVDEIDFVVRNYDIKLTLEEEKTLRELWYIMINHMSKVIINDPKMALPSYRRKPFH